MNQTANQNVFRSNPNEPVKFKHREKRDLGLVWALVVQQHSS